MLLCNLGAKTWGYGKGEFGLTFGTKKSFLENKRFPGTSIPLASQIY